MQLSSNTIQKVGSFWHLKATCPCMKTKDIFKQEKANYFIISILIIAIHFQEVTITKVKMNNSNFSQERWQSVLVHFPINHSQSSQWNVLTTIVTHLSILGKSVLQCFYIPISEDINGRIDSLITTRDDIRKTSHISYLSIIAGWINTCAPFICRSKTFCRIKPRALLGLSTCHSSCLHHWGYLIHDLHFLSRGYPYK